ncbi:MAG: TlpA disulfide reductase family protein [Bacteroidota bacterium]
MKNSQSPYRSISLIALLGLFMIGCGSKQQKADSKVIEIISSGSWKWQFELGKTELCVPATLNLKGDSLVFTIQNAEERIPVTEIVRQGDSLFMKLPVFDTEIKARVASSDSLQGFWQDYSRKGTYRIPFTASFSPTEATCMPEQPAGPMEDFGGKWAVRFGPDTENPERAIGIFEQQGNQLTGTFRTETGDYRYLSGWVDNDQLYLSTFDGSHAFVFTGTWEESRIRGTFYSGNHYTETWIAKRDENASLRSAESLTYLKPGYDRLAFAFPNLEGDTVSLTDEQFKGKVVVVQLMGSWCPNCMDETKLFTQWHNEYHDQGLEMVALAFERSDSFEQAAKRVGRLKDHFGSQYEFLIAGQASKKEAAAKLPMLNHVMSFPTSIFIDRNGRIRKIHTGFNGPGTGKAYQTFVEEYQILLEEMLKPDAL